MSGKFNFSLVDTDSTARKFKNVESALTHLAPSVRESLMPIIPQFSTQSYEPEDFKLAIPNIWSSTTLNIPAKPGYSHIFAFISVNYQVTEGTSGYSYADGVIYANGQQAGTISTVQYTDVLGGDGFSGYVAMSAKPTDSFVVKMAISNGDNGAYVNVKNFKMTMNCIYFN